MPGLRKRSCRPIGNVKSDAAPWGTEGKGFSTAWVTSPGPAGKGHTARSVGWGVTIGCTGKGAAAFVAWFGYSRWLTPGASPFGHDYLQVALSNAASLTVR